MPEQRESLGRSAIDAGTDVAGFVLEGVEYEDDVEGADGDVKSLPISVANGRTLGIVLPVEEETAKFAAFGIQRLLQFL